MENTETGKQAGNTIPTDSNYLTAEEWKAFRCADLLPPPGGEVVRGLLKTINELRRRIWEAK